MYQCHKQDCARVYGRAFITSYESLARDARIRELVYDIRASLQPEGEGGRTQLRAPPRRGPRVDLRARPSFMSASSLDLCSCEMMTLEDAEVGLGWRPRSELTRIGRVG